MTRYIDAYRDRFGVEPICRTLQIAPSTYYAARSRPASARCQRDQELKQTVKQVHGQHFGIYGVRKLWHQLQRQGTAVARCTVARLMRELGLRGVRRGRQIRTTVPAETGSRPVDLVQRDFHALAPNRLWVADLDYVRTWSGFAYVAFIIDAFSRYIVGWMVSRSLHTDLVLSALEQALWAREGPFGDLVHHSDRGVQYLSLRYTERLTEAGIATSVGSRGDSYDNALAETVNGLYKAELVYRRGPWRGRDDLELATLEWVDWFNNRRLYGALGYVPPAEYEASWNPGPLPALAGTQ
jgi:putative transposase